MGQVADVRCKRRELLDLLEKARGEIHKEILGQEELIDTVFYCLISPGRHHHEPPGGNLLIEGAHGLGKTRLVKTLGRVLNLTCSRIQFTVDLDPSSITGSSFKNDETKEFDFKPGALFANLVLADEITRASARIQSALFEGMEEQTVTVGGKTYPLPRPFFVFATTNIAEEIGSVIYQLPMGQRDRFFMSVRINPLPEDLERKLYQRTAPGFKESGTKGHWKDVAVTLAEQVLDADFLERISLFIAGNYLPGSVINDYITCLTRATRLEKSVLYGASHRAGFDLMRAAQTAAFLDDDDMVTEKHVLSVFVRVMRLRILLAYRHERGGQHKDDSDVEGILRDIVSSTPLFDKEVRR